MLIVKEYFYKKSSELLLLKIRHEIRHRGPPVKIAPGPSTL